MYFVLFLLLSSHRYVHSTLNSDFLQAAMGAYSDPTVIDHIRFGFPINVNGALIQSGRFPNKNMPGPGATQLMLQIIFRKNYHVVLCWALLITTPSLILVIWVHWIVCPRGTLRSAASLWTWVSPLVLPWTVLFPKTLIWGSQLNWPSCHLGEETWSRLHLV